MMNRVEFINFLKIWVEYEKQLNEPKKIEMGTIKDEKQPKTLK